MAQKPRTPVHFPRMKVRGRRNKVKLAARHTHAMVMPLARVTRGQDAHTYTFTPITEVESGAVSIRSSVTVDGYGRQIDGVDSIESVPEPPSKTAFSMSFQVGQIEYDRLHRLLFGGGEHDSLVQG